MEERKSHRFTFTINHSVKQRLDAASQATGLSQAKIIETVLDPALDLILLDPNPQLGVFALADFLRKSMKQSESPTPDRGIGPGQRIYLQMQAEKPKGDEEAIERELRREAASYGDRSK